MFKNFISLYLIHHISFVIIILTLFLYFLYLKRYKNEDYEITHEFPLVMCVLSIILISLIEIVLFNACKNYLSLSQYYKIDIAIIQGLSKETLNEMEKTMETRIIQINQNGINIQKTY